MLPGFPQEMKEEMGMDCLNETGRSLFHARIRIATGQAFLSAAAVLQHTAAEGVQSAMYRETSSPLGHHHRNEGRELYRKSHFPRQISARFTQQSRPVLCYKGESGLLAVKEEVITPWNEALVCYLEELKVRL